MKLIKEQNIVKDPEAFLAQKHKERKLASKQRQKETKEKREQLRIEKAKKWEVSKAEDIIYLGENYSHSLNEKESSFEKLSKQNLPKLNTALDLAKAMQIEIGELKFLSFSRKNSKISHYKRFQIPKKTGGFRLISAPMPKLKKAQIWILEEIFNKLDFHPNAHGCVVGKSIKTNANPHVKKDVVINQDLKNFFPTITYNRIKGVFISIGYSNQLATIFALLCSEPKIVDLSLLGENYYAQRGNRFLPQGSPCSPSITNAICRKLDFRLTGLAKKYNFTYTRYVDDLTFSASVSEYSKIPAILKYSKKIVQDENFNLHPDKLRIMKRNSRQEVTGVVVNEKTNIPKKNLKRFRALLYQIEKDGLQDKFWNKKVNVLAQIDGYANFIYQIDKQKGIFYKKRVGAILEKYKYKEAHLAKYVAKSSFINKVFGKIASFFKKK